ncbi:MAG: CHAT domain-containing protein, partial [Cyanobacteria bacterium Co-bin8]|nr:CHAT domain-containing protein [Cyanobacteria bacterium Co-bin8]
QGQYENTEALYLRSLRLYVEALGENHPHVATSLNNLALLYVEQGNYEAATPLLMRSLAIRERALGETHPDVAEGLNNLASLYQDQAQYSEAEPLYRRALTILETTLGADHLGIVQTINNLALLYQLQGNYSDAETLHLRSISIRERILGKNHPDVARSLNNLATLYQFQGNYDGSEPLIIRALNNHKAAFGDNHPDTALLLNNLALVYREQNKYQEAESLFLQALRIYETVLGEDHPHLASTFVNLAGLYQDQGDYSRAEQVLLQALTIHEAAFGENHPSTAVTLSGLSRGYYNQGKYAEAESLLLRSLSIQTTALGENHPNVAVNLNSLAWIDLTQGDILQSLASQQRAATIEETYLGLNLAMGSETRKRTYAATLTASTNITLSLHLQHASTNLEAAQLALNTVLRRKGRVLDAVTDSQQRLRQNLSPEAASLLNDYTTTQSQLAALLYGGWNGQDPTVYRTQVEALQQEVSRLENELARRSAEFRVATEAVSIEAVQALIPPDAALVELVQYSPLSPTQSRAARWGPPRYAAYVLEASGEPQWIDLGDAQTIDEAAFAFLNTLRDPGALEATRAAGRALDELVMQPIRPLLGDVTHLLVAPDSQLNLLPFAAMVDEHNRYLVESYTFTYLTSGRDLLRLQNPAPSRQPAVIMANPDYTTVATGATARNGAEAAAFPQPRGIADLRFGPLPGTEVEANAITPLLPNPLLLTEAAATENALKQVQAPSILHIATHGFFLEDLEFGPPIGSSRGEIEIVSATSTGFSAPLSSNRPTSSENPLLRSGLALAGFNSRASAGEDGVLTALEAANLDLRGTRLVVLSACETGLGAVSVGEGVYGLRRAFVMAGAESLLMSLWLVDDQGTADLMTLYYQRLLNGEGRSEALRQVQLNMLASSDYEHPFYWAAFMFSGNWLPIDNL